MDTDAKTTPVRVMTRLVLTCAVAMLGVAPAAQAANPEPEIREHPQGVKRTEIVRVEWAVGSPPAASDAFPKVFVERRHGLRWVTEAREGTGRVLLEHAGEGVWSARWQPTYYSPSGTYRIRFEGADYALTSNEFRVRPCRCVIPHQVRTKWREGRFRLRVKAEYAPGPPAGFRPLPTWVTTGRPLVRVFRDGRRIGSVLLRYKRGGFRGSWRGRRGSRDSVVFQLVALSDGFGNR
jgi:hypothetical protein